LQKYADAKKLPMNFLQKLGLRQNEPGSGAYIRQELIDKLNVARSMANRPFKITSGYRTRDHNKLVGGKPESSHVHGLAADIAVTTSRDRYFVLKSLLKAGFDRIGIGKGFHSCM
jgi:uncharacterized protein YcbK (DUF882 family)